MLLVIGYYLYAYPKAEIHLWMNQYHTRSLDFFFRYYTCVGEWVPYVVVAGLLFYKAGWASFLLADVAVSGLLAQRLKYVFDTDRPWKYFQDNLPDIQLPFVDGVELSKFYSFPSGHTTTFFALFFVVSLVVVDYLSTQHRAHGSVLQTLYAWLMYAIVPLCCFVWAVLGAYSRIYLSQHFLEDIFGGILLGLVSSVALLCVVPSLENTAFWSWRIPVKGKKRANNARK